MPCRRIAAAGPRGRRRRSHAGTGSRWRPPPAPRLVTASESESVSEAAANARMRPKDNACLGYVTHFGACFSASMCRSVPAGTSEWCHWHRQPEGRPGNRSGPGNGRPGATMASRGGRRSESDHWCGAGPGPGSGRYYFAPSSSQRGRRRRPGECPAVARGALPLPDGRVDAQLASESQRRWTKAVTTLPPSGYKN